MLEITVLIATDGVLIGEAPEHFNVYEHVGPDDRH